MYTYTYTYIYIKAYINKENDFCKLWKDVYVTSSHACMYAKISLFSIQLYIVIILKSLPFFLSSRNKSVE